MKSIFLLLALSLTFVACSETTPSNTVQDNTAEMPPADEKQDKPERGIEPSIIEAYSDVKESLTNSNAEEAAEAAENLQEQVQAHASSEEALQNATQALAGTKDLEEQRKHFEALSNALYDIVKDSKNLPQTLYWQYCPMAFDNKGASWISLEEEIKNPYFGDKMLKCGSVKETLQ